MRIHGPGNPQWPMDRFIEKSEVQVEKPSPDKPMPDYQHMTDEQLLTLHKRPGKASYGDRIVIRHILNKRGLNMRKIEEKSW